MWVKQCKAKTKLNSPRFCPLSHLAGLVLDDGAEQRVEDVVLGLVHAQGHVVDLGLGVLDLCVFVFGRRGGKQISFFVGLIQGN